MLKSEKNSQMPATQIGREGGTTTQPDISNFLSKEAQLKNSTRLGLYLYIQAHYKLAPRQLEWIAHFQSKQNIAQILSALKFVHQLTTNRRIRARMHVGESVSDVFNIKRVPFSQPRPKPRDQRRIGVGYRDKGSLPTPSRPKWDVDTNIRAVSLRDERDQIELSPLLELHRNQDKESSEVLSRLKKNYPEAVSFILNPLSIRNFTQLDYNIRGFPEVKDQGLFRDLSMESLPSLNPSLSSESEPESE